MVWRGVDAQLGGIRYPGLDRLAWWLFVLGTLLLVLLSPHALIRLGYPYEAPLQGPFIFKVHPGTYLVCLSLLCSLASRGHPMRAGWQLAGRHPLLSYCLAVMVITLVWVVVLHGTSGAAYIVDTHWLPAIAAFGLLCFNDARRRALLYLLAALMALNALLALIEYATQWRLWPLYVQSQAGGFAREEIFRSSALFGHPLANSQVTATMLAIATFLPMRPVWRWLHVLLLLLSMLSFGGRFAMVTTVALYGLLGVLVLFRHLVKGRFTYLQLTGGSVLITLLAATLAVLVMTSGLGERIFTGFQLDKSASVRLTVLSAHDYVSAEQLWFGMSAREVDLIALRLGLDPIYEAIENSWINLSLQFGLILFLIWLSGFVCLLVWLFRLAPAPVLVGICLALLNVSTTNGLAAKTVSMGLMVIYALCVVAQVRANQAVAVSSAQAQPPGGRKNGVRRMVGRLSPVGPYLFMPETRSRPSGRRV